MSHNATPEPTLRLDRMLRFTDLAINAGAIPLPTGLSPSALLQPMPDDGQVATEVRSDVPAEPTPPEPGTPATPVAAALDLIPDDAVVQSINAALDAVRATLQPQPDGVQHIPLEPQPAQSEHPITANARAAELAPASSQPATAVAPPESTAGPPDVMLPAAEPVQASAQSAFSVVDSVLHTATEAVTIPSLGGAGVDALAGLLQVASATLDGSHGADAALPIVDDIIGLAATGLPEVLHADHILGHDTHGPLGLVGSGLL